MACPCSVCSTSGWNCTPARWRSRSSNAATGAPAEHAATVNPSGARVTSLPWLIQTCCVDGSPRSNVPGDVTVNDVRPNSLPPVSVTSPPSDCAIAWNP